MLIQTACSIAIYCQRCGHIHVQQIPLFTGKRLPLHCTSCGHEMAEVTVQPHQGLTLQLDCGVCGEKNVQQYSFHQLKKISLEKLYCQQDHFELGYLGRRQELEKFLAYNAAAYAELYPGEQEIYEHQQMLLEALNRIHDFVAEGELCCDCGSRQITAALQGDDILLECHKCGSYATVPVHSTSDLQRLRPGCGSAIAWKRVPFLDAREK